MMCLLVILTVLLLPSIAMGTAMAPTAPTAIDFTVSAVPTSGTTVSACADQTVIGATNASPIVIQTSGTQYWKTGSSVVIASVGGNTNANGTKTITRVDTTHFSLDGTVGNGTYTSGGTAKCTYTGATAGIALQAALDAVGRDTTILLNAGETYGGRTGLAQDSGFQLNNITNCVTTGNACWIVIKTHDPAGCLPAIGARIHPQTHSSCMAKIVKNTSPSASAPVAITCKTGTGSASVSYYWLEGIEVTTTSGTLSGGQNTNSLIGCSYGDASVSVPSQRTATDYPDHISYSHLWVHGPTDSTASNWVKLGITLFGSQLNISDSYISHIISNGADASAINGWDFNGPLRVYNNYVSGAGENLIFGGASGLLDQVQPSDITITRNTFAKPMEWVQQNGCGAPTPNVVPTGAASSAGNVTGTVKYKTAFAKAGTSYTGIASSASSNVVVSSKQVTVTIQTPAGYMSNAGATTNLFKFVDTIDIYRTTDGGSTYYYVGAKPISGLSRTATTTTFTDDVADASLNVHRTAPAASTMSGLVEKFCGIVMKNGFELKVGLRVLIEGNEILNSPAGGQPGQAFQFTSRQDDPSNNAACGAATGTGTDTPGTRLLGGGCQPWGTVGDIDVSNNIVKLYGSAPNFGGLDPGVDGIAGAAGAFFQTKGTGRFRLHNNLMIGHGWGMDQTLTSGNAVISAGNHPNNLTITNNTVASTYLLDTNGHGVIELGGSSNGGTDYASTTGITFKNNILPTQGYSLVVNIGGSFNGCSTTSLSNYVTGWNASTDWLNNAIYRWPSVSNTQTEQGCALANLPGTTNIFPTTEAALLFTSAAKNDYSLQAGSPGHNAGSNGADMGVNMSALYSAMGLTWAAP